MTTEGYRVQKMAQLAHVTVRTLHHYDRIGLLRPSGRTAAGYRVYGEQDLGRLRQITAWRKLGLALEQIRRVLDDPGYETRQALLEVRERLRQRSRELSSTLELLDEALAQLERGKVMDPRKLSDSFDHTAYEREARERWGDTDAYAESARRMKGYSNEDVARMKAEQAEVFEAMAELARADSEPDSEEAMEIAERHRAHIDRWFYPCSRTMHASLADLYDGDPRFAKSFDRHEPGLSGYFAAAVRANAARR